MRATLIHSLIIFSTAFALSGFGVRAEVGDGAAKEETPAAEGTITQGEVAIILAQRLGLSSSLPASPSATDAAAALLSQGIAPFDGWKLDAELTIGDFARILCLALGLEVTEDTQEAYAEAAKAAGFGLEDSLAATDNVNSSTSSSTPSSAVELNSTDPLRGRQLFGEPDERATGADVTSPNPTSGSAPRLRAPVSPAVVAKAISQARRSGKTSVVVNVTPN